jgi:hypothetical protein
MAKSKRQIQRDERRKNQKEAAVKALQGVGRYRYKNHSRAEMLLPKPDAKGRKLVGPGQEFEGDSYFLNLVKSHELVLLEIIDTGMKEETLILDQPNKFTTNGAVEHVVVKPKNKPLNEEVPQDEQPTEEILINEDPVDLSGVQIIVD